MYYSGIIEHWGRGLSLIFEDCERAGLKQPKVTDENGVVRVTIIRPDLTGFKNDTINDFGKLIYQDVVYSPGISAVTLAAKTGKSITTIKRTLKNLINNNLIEYRSSKKTGGYFSKK